VQPYKQVVLATGSPWSYKYSWVLLTCKRGFDQGSESPATAASARFVYAARMPNNFL